MFSGFRKDSKKKLKDDRAHLVGHFCCAKLNHELLNISITRQRPDTSFLHLKTI